MENYYHAPSDLKRVQRVLDMVYMRNHLIEEIEQLQNADFGAGICDDSGRICQIREDELDYVIENRLAQLREVEFELSTYDFMLGVAGYEKNEFNETVGF